MPINSVQAQHQESLATNPQTTPMMWFALTELANGDGSTARPRRDNQEASFRCRAGGPRHR